jgi:hypothetical protein
MVGLYELRHRHAARRGGAGKLDRRPVMACAPPSRRARWMVWLATFAFATMADIGFASTNISDVTRSARRGKGRL